MSEGLGTRVYNSILLGNKYPSFLFFSFIDKSLDDSFLLNLNMIVCRNAITCLVWKYVILPTKFTHSELFINHIFNIQILNTGNLPREGFISTIILSQI